MSHGDGAPRPAPREAYQRWLDALAGAGWPSPPVDDGAGGGEAGGPDAERVAVGEALGRVTVAPVVARWPSPRADCAAMDGIAVRADELAAASAVRGPDDGNGGGTVRLAAGSFEWIDTGDPLPAGADTVVVRERLLPQADGSVIVTMTAGGGPEGGHGQRAGRDRARRNVRAAGEDFAAGHVLVPAGRRLRPGDLAAAAAGGHVTVAVAPRPVVAIIPTGDEIRPVGSVLRHGDIADTNSLMLAARCRQLGALPVVSDVVPDDPDALVAKLRCAAARADLVLVIAGSSRGRGDHSGAVLAQAGGVAVAGVAVRPGHPALLGHAKRPGAGHGQPGCPAAPEAGPRTGVAPVIGLPGYPLAAAVVFELFAVPLLAAIQGLPPAGDTIRARLDRDWASPAQVEDWVLVTLTPDAGGGLPLASPARRGAGSISLLASSDAWWPIPSGQGALAAGAEIEVRPVSG
jgi:putative molybdopterin biosynthesis protein